MTLLTPHKLGLAAFAAIALFLIALNTHAAIAQAPPATSATAPSSSNPPANADQQLNRATDTNGPSPAPADHDTATSLAPSAPPPAAAAWELTADDLVALDEVLSR